MYGSTMGGCPPRVLVVEADPRKRQRIATEFARHGYLVEDARDEQEALAKVSHTPFDVALLSARIAAAACALPGTESVRTRLRRLRPEMECLVLNRREYHRAAMPADQMLSLTARVLRERQAARRDRRLAQCLEETVLPSPVLSLPPFDIACVYEPSESEDHVGGDFYDLYSLGGRRLGLLLGDVSGRGLLVASHAAMARYYARAYARQVESPAYILEQLNAALEFDTPEETFVTLFLGILDLDTRRLTWSSAGHEPGLLLASGAPHPLLLMPTGMALGMLPEATYGEGICHLSPGSLLLLYTDGVTDPWTRQGDVADGPLADLLLQARDRPAAAVAAAVMDAACALSPGRHDDLTLIAIRG